MKVIFLDIDGVLNYGGCEDMINGMRGIEPAKVALLNRMIEATGAVCVLSSTWRLHYPIDEMQRFLEDRGFVGKIIDRTPDFDRLGIRGQEIDSWLSETSDLSDPVEAFVILDDCDDMHPHSLSLVQTDDAVGLTDFAVYAAISLLNS